MVVYIYIYIYVLWHYFRKCRLGLNHMTSQVKELVLLSLLSLSVVGSKVSSLKTTIHEAFSCWHHTNKIHTKRSTSLLLTAKIPSLPAIQLCVTSVAVQTGKQNFMDCMKDFPGLFNIHVSSERRSYLPEMRTIFQLHYGAVNQSPSQQMCQCLATGAIALCLHAVQQCGCKIILRERK